MTYSKSTAKLILELIQDNNLDCHETLEELLMFLDDTTINEFWKTVGDYIVSYGGQDEGDSEQPDLFYVIDPRRI